MMELVQLSCHDGSNSWSFIEIEKLCIWSKGGSREKLRRIDERDVIEPSTPSKYVADDCGVLKSMMHSSHLCNVQSQICSKKKVHRWCNKPAIYKKWPTFRQLPPVSMYSTPPTPTGSQSKNLDEELKKLGPLSRRRILSCTYQV